MSMLVSRMKEWRRRTWEIERRVAVLFATSGILLAALNVALVTQNQTLKKGWNEFPPLKPGDVLPPLNGFDPAGNVVRLDYKNEQKTVLLVFSPNCGWCTRNMANWRTLVANVDVKRFRFVAVSVSSDGAEEYLRKREKIEIPLIVEPNAREAIVYRMFHTPMTIVIGGDSRVEQIWQGALIEDQVDEVERYFGINLPGLT